MKLKRHKQVRKTINFFKTNFAINPPFKIILDGTFSKAALSFKINIKEQLPKYLEAEIEFGTTKCVLDELKKFGSLLYGPLKVLQQFKIYECGHEQSIEANKCICNFSRQHQKKNQRYFVATQDPIVSDFVRGMKGVPLLYIAYNAINLEHPSEKSKKIATFSQKEKLSVSINDKQYLEKVKQILNLKDDIIVKKKRKNKGRNPLCCLKSKKQSNKIDKSIKVKRNRIRVKFAKHVKEILTREGKWPLEKINCL